MIKTIMSVELPVVVCMFSALMMNIEDCVIKTMMSVEFTYSCLYVFSIDDEDRGLCDKDYNVC